MSTFPHNSCSAAGLYFFLLSLEFCIYLNTGYLSTLFKKTPSVDIKSVTFKEMKSLVVIFVVLIVGVIFIAVWDLSSSSTIDDTNYNGIAWRLPGNEEVDKLNNSFIFNKISICSTYFIKKFVGEKYLIACEEGNDVWTYYTVYTSQNKVYKTSDEIGYSLDPPEVQKDHTHDDIAKQKPRLPARAKLPVLKPAIEAK